MAGVNPYLNFNGNIEEAFNFYKTVFGGEFASVMRFKDAPAEYRAPGEDNKIMHISLPIGNGTVLMASDVPDSFGKVNMGSNMHIAISTSSEEEANKLFKGLSTGGKVTMPHDKTFWGSYFGMLTDKFGVQWMGSYDYNRPQ